MQKPRDLALEEVGIELVDEPPADAFEEGEITPVIEVPKGYLIYKIVKFHSPEQRLYGELPWWLKRVAFQERLARMVRERE